MESTTLKKEAIQTEWEDRETSTSIEPNSRIFEKRGGRRRTSLSSFTQHKISGNR
jgi:hypothetical protein